LDNVVQQPIYPKGFPNRWKGSSVDYQMDPDIVKNSRYKDKIKNALLSIPTLSIVMNQNDMFGTNGIYSNATSKGSAWERPTSVELIYPSGTQGFQVNCGIQMQGGFSRTASKNTPFACFSRASTDPQS